MNIISIAAATILIAAIPTAAFAGLKDSSPVIEADSARPTEAIGSCIADATDKIGMASYLPLPRGARVMIQVSGWLGEHGTFGEADIEDRGQNRHVTVWLGKTVWAKQNRHRADKIRACL